MKVLHSSTKIFLLLAWGWTTLDAQAPSPTPTPLVKLDLRFFPLHRRKIDNLFIQKSPEVFTPIKLRSRLRSETYEYKGPRELSLFIRRQNPQTGEFIYTPVTSVQLPVEAEEALVFLSPPGHARGREWENNWMIIAIDDGASAFPRGNVRILNATGLHLEGIFDETAISLNFGISRPIPVETSRGWTRVGFAIPVGDKKELVYGNRLQFESDSRSILVLRPPRRRRSIQIDTYLLEDTPDIPEQQIDPASDGEEETEDPQ